MPLRRFVQTLLTAGLCVAGVAAVLAQSRPDAPQDQPPTFRAGVQYIEIDVRVTDADNRFVRGLTKDDFVLLDDGAPQTISTATVVDLETESPVIRRVPGTIEPDVATNAGSGRMWVMLLGGFGLRSQEVGLRAQLAARQFVNQALGPNDEVAVVPVFGTMSRAQGFTRNRALMLSSIDRQQSGPVVTGDPAIIAFQVLEELCVRLGRIGGGRTAVLFFDPPAIFGANGPNPASRRPSSGSLRRSPAEWQDRHGGRRCGRPRLQGHGVDERRGPRLLSPQCAAAAEDGRGGRRAVALDGPTCHNLPEAFSGDRRLKGKHPAALAGII